MIVVTGATASGKTALAAEVAYRLEGEIVSADSRQVYRGMDIGTGKDYSDYVVNGSHVPFHLIDIADAGSRYNLFEYQQDFLKVYREITSRRLLPVVCGGSGMYVESIIRGYNLVQVPVNPLLRDNLAGKSHNQLKEILEKYGPMHNRSDLDTVKRTIRAIEIADYIKDNMDGFEWPVIKPLVVAVRYSREERRSRISTRLSNRLHEGMIAEVESLLKNGIPPEDLIYYGLEYKYVTLYLTGELTYQEMESRLETEIHRFAKRQMTWFRGMERRGVEIEWIEGALSLEEKADIITNLFRKG
ncbi:MAG: tRNA (adenosine(37)-N6)-dimethylallyltransferase MiaA [Bacteroidales bacterium]|nr:tRNA (adenosine(37)-N6)-dimethylallyltransferase MiaA [Bacteroidales bacterium]